MTTLYERALLNDPVVRLSYSDPLVGLVRPDGSDVELDNGDRYFDDKVLLGERLDLSRFDEASNEQQWELSGLVTEQETDIDSVRLQVVAQDLDDLETLLPKRLVTAAQFPLAHPTLGLGWPIPVVIGVCGSTFKAGDAWEMAYVGENTGANQYDYLVGEGTFTNVTVYRMTVGDVLFTIPPAEYTVNTAAYSGVTVIRFALRQADFSGSLDRIFVAADGMASERNGATAIKSLLNNSTWGLGLAVNSASFTTAASDWDAVGGLYVDAAMTERRPALDWINDILIMRGLTLSRNSSGEWTVAVMKAQSTLKAILGHGAGQDYGGVVSFGGLSRTSLPDAVKSLVVDYRYDQSTQQYGLSTTARAPFGYGRDLRVTSRVIRDRTTADKVADFVAKRLTWHSERISVSADMTGRQLRPGDLFRYTSSAPSINTYFMVQSLGRHILEGTTDLEGVGWGAAIFTWTPATLPAEPADVTETDYTRQTPTAVTGLSIDASGVESDGQNGYQATVTLQYTVPAEAWAQTWVRVRRYGATNWETVAQGTATGSNLQTKITGLITGLSYDYLVERVNTVAPALSAAASLTNQPAPIDIEAPAAPTALVITDQHLKALMVEFTPPSDKDVRYWHWEVRTGASGGGSLVDEGDTEGNGSQIKLTLNQIGYATTRYLRIKGVDYSGNGVSGGNYSASLSFSFTQVVSGDMGTNSVPTLSVQDDAITDTAYYYATATESVTTTEEIVGIITINADTLYGKVEVKAGFVVDLPADGGGSNTFMELRIRKGSYVTDTQIGYGVAENPSTTSNKAETVFTAAIDVSPAASQTYVLTAKASTGSMDVGYRVMAGLSAKR